MKKFIACLVALMICVSMVMPVAVSADTFTPSVTNKPSPDIVPVTDPDGNPAMGVILDVDGQILDYVYEDCLVVTSIANAKTSELIPDESRDLLLSVYEKLVSGEMTIPYEKHNASLNKDNMVIRDLFDATFLCDGQVIDHPEMLLPEGVVLQLTFNLGVAANDTIYAMTYNDGQWNPVVKTVNNGDGTVTCTFEHLCPIEFSVEVASEEKPGTSDDENVKTGDPEGEQMSLWIVLAVVCLAAVVVLAVVYKTKLSKKD